MFHIVLYQPEIPPNTGNVMRLCANAGARLHLIEPLGFAMDEPRLRRAGLDYRERTRYRQHPDFDSFLAREAPQAVYMFTRHGRVRHDTIAYAEGDALVFGPETRGLTPEMLARSSRPEGVRVPMRAGNRSINLGNAVAIALFEAWRQQDFAGAGDD